MPQNFLACDREQELLLAPRLREWLAEDHFGWFVIDVVGDLDLAAFLAAYRADGHGRAAHDPAMMVALIVYAYAIGERSSRRIQRRCREDVAFRVITANQAPDHATIARFRVRHERALSGLFGQVLGLCADAGLMRVGVVAVDGTKVHANASERATRDARRATTSRSRARSSNRRPRSTPSRTNSSASAAVTSCRARCRRARGAGGGCARPGGGSISGAPNRPGRSRARGPRDSSRRAGGWSRNSRSSGARTPTTRPTERAE
jgi:transposase